MKVGAFAACAKTGFVVQHAAACEDVAQNANSIILFREPGMMAQTLIAEGYSMKGFRIDTKSCNWGPMAGFVCADPNLTKDPAYAARNKVWTSEALSGHIVEKFFGKVQDAEWVADVMPIVISRARIEELRVKGLINPGPDPTAPAELVGVSQAPKDPATILSWRLVPVGNASLKWLNDGRATPQHYVLCVNQKGAKAFKQQYPPGVVPIRFRGNETILGLTNPGTRARGFKACVTADYDLFAIWPQAASDPVAARHNLNQAVLNRTKNAQAPLPGGVARMGTVDTRLQAGGNREHHRFGDVSGRVMAVKTMLNTALMSRGGYQGGNAIHHNDEAGNFALAKGTLVDCLPLIGFVPGVRTVLVDTLPDFKELVLYAREKGFSVQAKPVWLAEAGAA